MIPWSWSLQVSRKKRSTFMFCFASQTPRISVIGVLLDRVIPISRLRNIGKIPVFILNESFAVKSLSFVLWQTTETLSLEGGPEGFSTTIVLLGCDMIKSLLKILKIKLTKGN